MPKNLIKRGGVWYAEKVYKGKRYRFSLETDSLREAQKRLDEKLRELTATHWGEKPRRSFREIVERFIDEHLPTLKPKSQTRYLVSLGQLGQTFESVKLDEIGSGLLYEFERARYNGGTSKPTIRRDLACLSSVFGFAMTLEWITQNPVPAYMKARSKKGLKESDPKTRNLDHDEEAGILRRSDQDFADAVAFAIDTGLRKEEQFSLMRHHIDLKRREVIVDAIVAKNSKARRVPLLPRSLEIVRRRMLSTRSPYLFAAKDGSRYSERSNYMLKRLKAVAKAAGLKPVTWHDLRRTCGCRLLQDYGMSMEKVRDWLGHSSVTVTEKSYAFLRVDDLHQGIRQSADRAGNVVSITGD
jgi:integrase